jgi:hypothetical protein
VRADSKLPSRSNDIELTSKSIVQLGSKMHY